VKRHPALVPLSHDHHHTLVAARALRRGDPSRLQELRAELERHFREEEELVFPLLGRLDPPPPELGEACVQHAQIRARLDDPDAELAELLEAHVRLEEQVLFELVQQVAAEALTPRRATGATWGAESEDLNATILEWPPAQGPPEHVNETRDVLLVCLDGEGTLSVDRAERPLRTGVAEIVPKGARRAVSAGPRGIRYLTAHLRRGGLQIGRAER
jgi:quercetin dioxygenase-like cupin family protein